MKLLNIENWNRKKQYQFFKNYKDPFFNITANVDVTKLYDYCKQEKLAFNLAFLHQLLTCANSIDVFKLRIKNGEVYIFDAFDIGTAILKEDKSFVFCYFSLKKSIHRFVENATVCIDEQTQNQDFDVKEERLDLIHTSILPWISFTGIKHARKGDEQNKGIPKFMIGKYFEQNNQLLLPLSIEVHHGLMDGYAVGQFFNLLDEQLKQF
jgi:chloramphenicol O-acetyltransferase type A